ncbi:LacI family DNA-binding transcriptional regulator [Actinoplanes oblitus]|uniref:LacI family DNA-binding transcriptional regulator n=1 Tax=Actinoplanes oblitus TaxID=3040509 RepID=A0ABY8WGG6_9ACTN|nr:LacI family DNA-binding transcriptional regulator [Actinoplanes oblitus]WIM96956.1 LacI family DNA-binding transcriptional regulator [Actinoplanes oblitus]
MKPPHRIQEIAARAGLSPATVDRVLHQRGGVRESTAGRVHQAIAELDRESATARVLTIDLVLPTDFGADVPAALDPDLPIQSRVHRTDDPAGALGQVARSRSDGVIVLAPPLPEVADAVARLDVPVVTLNVDLPAGKRIAHVGVDDFEAGATAAYLVEQWLHDRAGDVLVVAERAAPQRVAGFRSVLGPARRLHVVTGPDQARATLAGTHTVRAVYAPAAGDCAGVVAAFAAERRNYDVFVAHGLTPDTLPLLRTQQISAVLHQDLGADLRHAGRAMLRAHGLLPGPIRSHPAAVRILTPFNVPVS